MPNFEQEMKKWLKKQDLQYITCKDYKTTPSKSLYFYHMQKTGGMSLVGMLRADKKLTQETNPKLVFEKYENESLSMARFDYKDDMSYQEEKNWHNDSLVFYASHEPYPFHKTSQNSDKFLLTTIVREPFWRIKSHYLYACRNKKINPTQKGFEEFFRSEENINYQSKFLSDKKDAKDAIKNLKEEFHSYAPLEQIQDLQELYLSIYGSADVIIDRINTGTSEKIDLDVYKDEILALNKEDTMLYDFVLANPRIPSLKTEENINPHMVSFTCSNVSKKRVAAGLQKPTRENEELFKKEILHYKNHNEALDINKGESKLMRWVDTKEEYEYIRCKTPAKMPKKSLYIYHLRRVGTRSLFLMLQQNILQISNTHKPELYKIKYKNSHLLISSAADQKQIKDKTKKHFNDDSQMILDCGMPYPFHKTSQNSDKFDTTALIRDPFDRVQSDFFATCEAKKVKPTRKRFEKFFKDENNINHQSKFLSGLKTSEEKNGLFKTAAKNLKEEFHSYAATDDIKKLQEFYLSKYGLSDCIMGEIGVTMLKESQLFCEEYKDEVMRLNEDDVLLYMFAQENPKIPTTDEKESINYWITIIKEDPKTKNQDLAFVRNKDSDDMLIAQLTNLL